MTGRRGRFARIPPALMDKAIQLVEDGHYEREAAALVGVRWQTWHIWKQRGEEDKLAGRRTRYAAFADRVEEALLKRCGVVANKVIGIATNDENPNQFKAASWLLARWDPERYRDPDRASLQVNTNVAVSKDEDMRDAVSEMNELLRQHLESVRDGVSDNSAS